VTKLLSCCLAVLLSCCLAITSVSRCSIVHRRGRAAPRSRNAAAAGTVLCHCPVGLLIALRLGGWLFSSSKREKDSRDQRSASGSIACLILVFACNMLSFGCVSLFLYIFSALAMIVSNVRKVCLRARARHRGPPRARARRCRAWAVRKIC
jgi:hypothetical protein